MRVREETITTDLKTARELLNLGQVETSQGLDLICSNSLLRKAEGVSHLKQSVFAFSNAAASFLNLSKDEALRQIARAGRKRAIEGMEMGKAFMDSVYQF